MIQETKILTQYEINKKIIAKAPKVRPYEDLLGPFDRYNDENFEIYNRKKKQFFEAARIYNRKNQETLICSKKRLNNDYLSTIDYDFLHENYDTNSSPNHVHSPAEGIKIRKRTQRRINQVPEHKQMICNLEPWFRRHLILNKFIWAARIVVIKNRLLRRLEILKDLDVNRIKELENQGPKIFNVSYEDIFHKFLTN